MTRPIDTILMNVVQGNVAQSATGPLCGVYPIEQHMQKTRANAAIVKSVVLERMKRHIAPITSISTLTPFPMPQRTMNEHSVSSAAIRQSTSAQSMMTQAFNVDSSMSQSMAVPHSSPQIANDQGKALLEVKQLSVAYGKVEALLDFNMRVNEGQIVSVVGPNGAGKTTLLAAIMGVLGSKGEIDFDGSIEHNIDVEHRVARGLNLVPEKRELFGSMSIEDNLMLGAFQRYRHRDKTILSTLDEVYSLFPRLKERRGQQAGTLSGGERQMLAVGRALMAKPKLLMLDEPSLGLAPLITREIFKIIDHLRAQGVSILLVEQNARAALKLADYAYVLEMGELSMQGTGQHLVTDPRIIESYLGINSKHQDILAQH